MLMSAFEGMTDELKDSREVGFDPMQTSAEC